MKQILQRDFFKNGLFETEKRFSYWSIALTLYSFYFQVFLIAIFLLCTLLNIYSGSILYL